MKVKIFDESKITLKDYGVDTLRQLFEHELETFIKDKLVISINTTVSQTGYLVVVVLYKDNE